MDPNVKKPMQKSVLGKGLASLFPGVNTTPPAEAAESKEKVNHEESQAEQFVVQTTISTPPPPPKAVTQGSGAVVAGMATTVEQEGVSRDRHMGITMALIKDIVENPYQPRRHFDDGALKELSASIKENGIIQPIVVRKLRGTQFELIAGERRLRAAKLAGLDQVPVVIRKTTDKESLQLALIENIQRENLNCIDTALGYSQLIDEFKLTQEEVALQVGKDRASVANHLRLLRLPQPIIEDLRKGDLSFGHGKALLSVENEEVRLAAARQMKLRALSVREAEKLVKEMRERALGASTSLNGLEKGKNESPLQLRMSSLSIELTRKHGVKVDIKGTEKRGKLVFYYRNRNDLERLLSSLQNN